jgi:excisionase family DNA binding protein
LDPSILLASPNMVALLESLSDKFDFVLFDSPPVLSAPDATILAMLAQGTLLVVNPGRASRRAIRRSRDKLQSRKDANIVGIALNRTSLSRYAYSYTRQEEMIPQPGYQTRLPHRLGNIISSLPVIGRPKDPDLVSLSQAAIMLGVRRDTVKRWRKEGRLPAVRKGLRWWVKQEELRSTLMDSLVTERLSDLPVIDGPNSSSMFEDIQQPATGSIDEPLGHESVKESDAVREESSEDAGEVHREMEGHLSSLSEH